ncbi:MAG: DUF551 domain-containing protein [Fibrobacter sp.]|nr:DUF551 domain-containing protein [Fibrobacter sp.]
MTEKEIVQELRCCASGESEEECPFTEKYGCDGCPKVSADLIERLTAENAALREKVPQWISVEERLPIDRLKKYLVSFRDAGGLIVDMARYFPSDGWTCNNWDVPQKLITHWMPLPEAPEKGERA